uniref:Transmembrane 6 superfamily member 1/2 transmembrane domain-containing protein n=1 Tax=Plectus sambesii TaxID=2011161 RepID=A0A914VA55_9BILA
MAAFRLLYALTVSLLAAPALYGIEMNRNLLDPLKALAIRLATMVATVVLAAAVKPKALHGSSFWYFAFFWGAFSAVGKLTMALEIFGHIRGVASYWPSKVEPYLLTSHGAAFL